jgi:hypothetical protein
MSIDCDASASGVQDQCSYPAAAKFSVVIVIDRVREDGYHGLQAVFRWDDATLDYVPAPTAEEERLLPGCDGAFRYRYRDRESGEQALLIGCTPSFGASEPMMAAGPAFVVSLQCQQAGTTTLEWVHTATDRLQASGFYDEAQKPQKAYLAPAFVSCG